MLKDKKLVVLGSGYMAQAIIGGLLKAQAMIAQNIIVINPIDQPTVEHLSAVHGLTIGQEEDLVKGDIVLLAFKPQNLTEAMAMYEKYWQEKQMIISILAGVSLKMLEDMLKKPLPVIRTMPNLALAVGDSATVYSGGAAAQAKHLALAEEFFSHLGLIKPVDESAMECVTALSGCGPAYICYLAEAMMDGACANGMDQETALALTVQTLKGTVKFLEENQEQPAVMRKKITSAKGATEAGIKAMKENGFYEAVLRGFDAASQRTKELGAAFLQNK
ncbi:MAG: pyrroline-5-carboxylate reductase [Clostridiales bacterium]